LTEFTATLADVSASISAANAVFLRELSTPQGVHGLPASTALPIRAALVQIDDAARHRLSALPFTLYSLGFSDAAYWSRVIAGRDEERALSRACQAMARTGVFLAWHLVRAGPAAASLALGMTAEVAAQFRALTLTDLDRLSSQCQLRLAPRWPNCPEFWKQLACGATNKSALDQARFLGLRLLAAEVLPAPGAAKRTHVLHAS
jgi:hypothetical protein